MIIIKYDATPTAISDYRYASTITITGGGSKKWRNGV
jgi:hypothetical protein